MVILKLTACKEFTGYGTDYYKYCYSDYQYHQEYQFLSFGTHPTHCFLPFLIPLVLKK